jgi:uncharacterized membrane protein
MIPGLPILAAAAAGALFTYVLDPQLGRRRRAIARDKLYGNLSRLDDAAAVVGVDMRNRMQGVAAALRGRLTGGAVPDEVLAERVRAKLGRVVSHPSAIEVRVNEGRVALEGPVLKREVKRLLRAVESVRGVKGIEEYLEPHERAGDVPALQGGSRREERLDIAQGSWSPATRFLVGAGGAAAMLGGLSRRTAMTPILVAAGAVMLVRAATNMDLMRLMGRRGRRSIELQNSIYIEAPLEAVYRFWSDPGNYPKFMRNVRSVHRNRDDSWHWEVAGPLGTTLEWDSRVTQSEPLRLIAWASVPGVNVQHSGIVRFWQEGTGTRVDIRLAYNPVAGALGHLIASLFGRHPQKKMDEDLMRVKGYFETGKRARDAAQAPSASQPLTAPF